MSKHLSSLLYDFLHFPIVSFFPFFQIFASEFCYVTLRIFLILLLDPNQDLEKLYLYNIGQTDSSSSSQNPSKTEISEFICDSF
jgi:hypothetical protein